MSALLADITEIARIAKHFAAALAQDVTALIAILLCVGGIVMGSTGLAMIIHHDAEMRVAMGGE